MAGRQSELFAPMLPPGMDYHPEFLAGDEEVGLIAWIRAQPLTHAPYKQYLSRRRTLSFGSGYDFERNVPVPAPEVPPFLRPLRARVAALLALAPEVFSHALLSEYAPGTPLGWHRDVPSHELVVGVSLGSACRMRLRPYPPRTNLREGVITLTLEPRSLYVLAGDARWRWQHSIPPTPALRWSITFRTPRPSAR